MGLAENFRRPDHFWFLSKCGHIIPSWDKVQGHIILFHHGTKLWASQNIFASPFKFDFCPIWPYPRQNPMYRPQAPAWQASPWGHRPSSSAPCAVPMRLSRIGRHIKDEPRAKQRASLCVFSSHFSSVSRNVRSAVPSYFFSPLVHVAHTIMHTMVLNLVGLLKFSSSTQVLQLYSCSTVEYLI